MDNFFLIAFTFLLGFVLQKFKIFPDNMPLALNKFVIYISLPALILLEIPKLSFSYEMFVPPFCCLGCYDRLSGLSTSLLKASAFFAPS